MIGPTFTSTAGAAPDVEGRRVLLSISKSNGEERDRQAAWQQHKGESKVVRQKNHPQNNLCENSFCQQILWRKSLFGQEKKNPLMHFRAHNSSAGIPFLPLFSTADQQTT